MKIGIDISPLCKSRTGVAMYIYYLVRSLTEIDSKNTYFLYANKSISLDFPLPKNFFIRPAQIPLPQFQAWFHLGLPFLFRRDKLDIFHGSNFLIPHFAGCKTVSTVFDLSSIVLASQHKLFHRLSHMMFLRSSMKRASKLLAISEATRDEICRIFPQYSEKTITTLLAASPEFFPITEDSLLQKVQKKYKLPKRFILYVGTLEPRKNIFGLLQAFNKVKDKIPQKLVVAGGKGWKFSSIFDYIKQNSLEDSVVFTGYISQNDLPVLYSLAELFAYPSFYEGFGLPVIESMACGTPVITSNRSSLAEVAGDSALLIDPDSPNDIGEKLLNLSNDPDLRLKLTEAGLERAKCFSWKHTAQETLKVYQQLANQERQK